MNGLLTEKNRRVLIIDDNQAIHDDFRKILAPDTAKAAALDAAEMALFGSPTSIGRLIQFEMDSAHQGQEGVLLVKNALDAGLPYAMAFVDIRMPPGWDGVETTQKIWEIDPDIQIVICTAYSDYSWHDLSERIGHRDGLVILKKPFDTVEALQLAHALTEKWWLHKQSLRKMEDLENRIAERTSEMRHTNRALQTEVTEHQRAEETLRQSEERFSKAFRAAPVAIVMTTQAEDRCVDANDHFLRMIERGRDEVIGRAAMELGLWAVAEERESIVKSQEEGRRIREVECLLRTKSGSLRNTLVSVESIALSGEPCRLFIIQDITERKRMEAQLFRSQKLETVGKLAGGVAHEFNSILTTIICQSELMLCDLPANHALCENAIEIRKAADRAATLTRQLLAYGRKQRLQPETLDLNRVLEGMDGVLRHLMGREVHLRLVPFAGLKEVKADAGQIEQVIMNLAMNARDAMPKGGDFTLETANVTVDRENLGGFVELKPDDYVMLAVTDTGRGMSPEVKARAFEPFFSTKGVGQGPGLGLATCYGIVKQSGGYISVDSEIGRGTTFKIYLPQIRSKTQAVSPPPALPRGTETILLVEEDSSLREMAAELLRRLGYTVMSTADGASALRWAEQRGKGTIDLLVVDLMASELGGNELFRCILALHPETKTLFTSARAGDILARQGPASPAMTVLQKPFTPGGLALKVREAVDHDP